MMNFLDIAGIVFACTAANHLGLIPAIESFIKRRIPVVGCIKCLTFWSVLVYGIAEANSSFFTLHSSFTLLAISFLCAWSAIWLDLFMGIIDHLYLIIYEQIYPTANPADTDALSASDAVPDVSDCHG